MDGEDPKNIRDVCRVCVKKTMAETQRNLPVLLSALVGRYVKKRFVADGNGKGELMWVHVTSVNEEAGTLMGTLDNEPTIVKDVSCGDEVVVYRDEVVAVLE